MPVYEFYCSDCHVVFNFLSRRVNVEKRPDCPRCGRPGLERRVSPFALSRGGREETSEGMPDLDGERLEKVMEGMAGEMEGMDENDPRQMARFMRRLSEGAGVNLGSGAEEAIRRLEAGEDPERIEAELGDLFDGEEPFSQGSGGGAKKRSSLPAMDDRLYLLE